MKKIVANLTMFAFAASLTYAQQVDHTSDAAAIAKELTNPNTTLGSLNFQCDYIHYRGDLPVAGQQNAFIFSFQPVLPYPVKPGLNIFLRPLIPVVITGPGYTDSVGFESKSGLGDIVVDLVVGKTWKFNKTSVMFASEYWYYLASADPVGSQHRVRLQISPVVPLPWGGKHKK